MNEIINRIEPLDSRTRHMNVVCETPKGSRVKYSFDFDSGCFILSKTLPEGMMFPFNFGFIPNTLSDDGDPLDVLLLNEEPLVTGCLLKVKAVGVVKATQTEDGKPVIRCRRKEDDE